MKLYYIIFILSITSVPGTLAESDVARHVTNPIIPVAGFAMGKRSVGELAKRADEGKKIKKDGKGGKGKSVAQCKIDNHEAQCTRSAWSKYHEARRLIHHQTHLASQRTQARYAKFSACKHRVTANIRKERLRLRGLRQDAYKIVMAQRKRVRKVGREVGLRVDRERREAKERVGEIEERIGELREMVGKTKKESAQRVAAEQARAEGVRNQAKALIKAQTSLITATTHQTTLSIQSHRRKAEHCKRALTRGNAAEQRRAQAAEKRLAFLARLVKVRVGKCEKEARRRRLVEKCRK